MEQDNLIKSFLDEENIFAVVGVSENPKKYGHKVFFDLIGAGYKVYPIHPDDKRIGKFKRFRNLKSLPERPDVVVIVVPPKVTEKIVEQCRELGISKIWMQPGSESREAVDYCRENNIEVLHNTCIMVRRKSK